jgi:hypothetical protein
MTYEVLVIIKCAMRGVVVVYFNVIAKHSVVPNKMSVRRLSIGLSTQNPSVASAVLTQCNK